MKIEFFVSGKEYSRSENFRRCPKGYSNALELARRRRIGSSLCEGGTVLISIREGLYFV
jgi:hypothetical protein